MVLELQTQTTGGTTPDALSFNAFDGFRFVTNSGATASTVAMSISSAGVVNAPTLSSTNITARQVCKAWANIDGNANLLMKSYGVAAYTRHATAVYSITFSTSLNDTDYAWAATAGFNSAAQSNYVSSPNNTSRSIWKTTTALRVQTYFANATSNINVDDLSIIVWN